MQQDCVGVLCDNHTLTRFRSQARDQRLSSAWDQAQGAAAMPFFPALRTRAKEQGKKGFRCISWVKKATADTRLTAMQAGRLPSLPSGSAFQRVGIFLALSCS